MGLKKLILSDPLFTQLQTEKNTFFALKNIVVKDGKYFIVQYQKELTWPNVVNIGEFSDYQFLIDYGTFRTFIVDQLIILVKKYTCECAIVSVGSVNPTSDYDITVTSPLTCSSALNSASCLIKTFNNTFRYIFLNESGIIFDTNLYGVGYYEPTDIIIDNSIFQSVSVPDVNPKYKYVYFVRDTPPSVQEEQRTYAFAKLYIMITNDEYLYMKDILDSKNRNKLLQSKQLVEFLSAGVDMNNMEVTNNIYVKEVRKVENIKKRLFLTLEQSVANEYQNAIAKANFYANEAYFTRGAFFHVVGILQSKIDLPMTLQEYINSYIENAGDTLKSYGFYLVLLAILKFATGKQFQEVSRQLLETIIDMSKYYYRTMDALYNIGLLCNFPQAELDYILEVRDITNLIRVTLRGKNICDSSFDDLSFDVLGLNDILSYISSNEDCIPLAVAEALVNSFIELTGFKPATFRIDFLTQLAGYLNRVT